MEKRDACPTYIFKAYLPRKKLKSPIPVEVLSLL